MRAALADRAVPGASETGRRARKQCAVVGRSPRDLLARRDDAGACEPVDQARDHTASPRRSGHDRTWRRHTIALADFAGIEPHAIAGIFVGATGSPRRFELRIDDVRLE
jgi:hypothetical protein